MARGGGRWGFSNSSGSFFTPSAAESLIPLIPLTSLISLIPLDAKMCPVDNLAALEERRNVPALAAEVPAGTDETDDKRDGTCILIKVAPLDRSNTQQSDIRA